MHLVIDGLTRTPAASAQVRSWLMMMPELIGMAPIREASGEARLVVMRANEQLHGIVFIAESHLSVHSHGKIINLDIFACKRFDEVAVIQRAIKHFGLTSYRVWLDAERLNLGEP